MKHIILFALLIFPLISIAQLPRITILKDSMRSSFRGLSVPSDSVVWVSGSNGTVGRSTDAGKTWKWITVPGYEKRDFRDIEAFNAFAAVIMAVDNPAYILKTIDGGETWKIVFEKNQEGMFLDAMHFQGRNGICVGDPVILQPSGTKRFYLLSSSDEGDSWHEDQGNAPAQEFTESIFAASGTNIIQVSETEKTRAIFITGGARSNLVRYTRYGPNETARIPIMQGKPSAGAFSMTRDRNGFIYITGGDYVDYWKDSANVVYTSKSGWKRSKVHGYRSCIIQTDKKTFITCGTNGVDISFDGCKTWKLIHGDGAKGTDGFNVCEKSKSGKVVYFAGSGRVGKLIF